MPVCLIDIGEGGHVECQFYSTIEPLGILELPRDHLLESVTREEDDTHVALNVTQKRITEALEARGSYKNLEEWATHKRVGRACKLILSRPEYTIESIAAEAGFSSPRTFYRKFQSETGLSPTEYRQTMSRDEQG